MSQPGQPIPPFPEDTTPAERAVRLEQLARERSLPTLTTWEAWDASFGPVVPPTAEELARFEAGLSRDKR